MNVWHKGTLALIFLAGALPALAKDFLVVASRPNHLNVIDLAERKAVGSYAIPGNGLPSTITVPETGRVAYVLTNRNESITGIDIDTGKEVFRADMSSPGLRVKSMMAATVSRDGEWLYVHQIPTRLKKNEFEALDTRIAVYRTADGVGAKPVRTFPAPRRIGLLAATTPGRFAALGWDIYVFDATSGKIDKTFPLRNWKRAPIGEPDILDFWPQYEQTQILSAPFYAPRTDVDPKAPEAFQFGIMTFDLDAEAISQAEIANAEAAIFSSVVNPANRNEVFAVMNQLYRIDLPGKKITQQVTTDRTYYAINISSDGKEIYLGGATDIVSVHDATTLKKIAEISIPGGRDQGTSSLRVIRRP